MASYNALGSNNNVPESSPYGAGDPYYTESTGHISPRPLKKTASTSKWIKFGIPVAIIVIVAAVVGGVVGSRRSKTVAASSGSKDPGAAASSAASVKASIGRYATGTNSKYMVPVYPSTVCSSPALHPAHDRKFSFRPTQLPSPLLPLLHLIRSCHGRPIHSNLALPALLVFGQIDLDFSRLLTNGTPFPTSSRKILISKVGTTLSSAMRQHITTCRPLLISWTEIPVYLTTLEKSR